MSVEEIIIELKPKEVALILALRNKFQFGEVTIIMKDGVPLRLRKAYEFDELIPPI